jgi:DNA-binding NarL/FixJ family response regulator
MARKEHMPVRIVIADAHYLFREGLLRLLETRPHLKVVGVAGDGDVALQRVAELSPDLLLLDLVMPRVGGLDILRELQRARTSARIVVLTAAIDRADTIAAMRLGTHGVILKTSATELLFDCIDAVIGGGYWVGNSRVDDVVDTLRALTAAPPAPAKKQFGLTQRELEIVNAVLGGSSTSEIAATLSISERTVKHHLTNVFDKLGVWNRLELALFALRHGLPEDTPPGPAKSDAR